MAGKYVIYWWDTEDYINPESDDALLLLLKEFKKRSMPAVFKMVGEKTRVLVERGRTDIIGLLKDDLFEIGYHTDFHSAHPTIAEYTERLGWQEGVGEILLRETPGLDATRETFGKEVVCYGQPGTSYTPFVYAAMRAWGVPAYLGGSVYLGDDFHPTSLHGIFNLGGMWKVRSSFDARRDDAALPDAKKRMAEAIGRLPEGGIISHGNHPNEWSLDKWWDEVNFLRGANPVREEWKPAPAVSKERMKRRVALYGEYLDWVKAQGVEAIGVRRAMELYHSGRREIGREVVGKIAAAWAKGEVDAYFDEEAGVTLSAAQGLSLLAQAAAGPDRENFAVNEVDAPAYLDGLSTEGGCNLNKEGLVAAARRLAAHVRSSGMLPSRIETGGGRDAAPAVFGVALSRLVSGRKSCTVKPSEVKFLPAKKVKVYGRNVGPWSIHHEAFTGKGLYRYTCLLSWSYRRLLPFAAAACGL
jgi:hypothetical protein